MGESHSRTATHWGTGVAEVEHGRLVRVHPDHRDPAPSPLLQSMPDSVHSTARINRPAVRRGFLRHGPGQDGGNRGADSFVEVSWNKALDLVASELHRVRSQLGNEAIFAGSYGWASAGRFHHAQSQIHRFMNCIGGYTSSVDNYSYAAALVIAPYVVGPLKDLLRDATVWPVVKEQGELVVAFGGLPLTNTQVASGGISRHDTRDMMLDCHRAGVEFVNISPLSRDLAPELQPEWLAPRPNTDTAVMLGLAHTLVSEDLHDQAFLDQYTVGFDRFLPYLTGETDGTPKSAEWAGEISGLPPDRIRGLARRMACQRTLILATASLQRADHGEQPMWMTVVLAAMLGQIGLPGGGFGLCYGSDGVVGSPVHDVQWPALPQGENPVRTFIPVARVADMLLSPGAAFDYKGQRYQYPDVRLVYWAGGNPFHHHQDLNKLVKAFRQPETVVVHEISWTATARHADIVLPVTTPLERNDIGMTRQDTLIVAMKQAIAPQGQARDDYAIFSALAQRLGVADTFTEGRDEDGWLQWFWRRVQDQCAALGHPAPDFRTFWDQDSFRLPETGRDRVLLEQFRRDPEGAPLRTPSGRIEIFSEVIDSYRYADCPGHPVWLDPAEWLGSGMATRFPLHLTTAQPRNRLHSQLDDGKISRASKVRGREPITMNPRDAAVRGVENGDIVRVFNDRGACLAGVRTSSCIRRGVVELRTGAWFDPESPGEIGSLDKHGNANVLTADRPTSPLAQATTAHTALVEVERYEHALPSITAFEPPELIND